MAVLSIALGACSTCSAGREGTMEYPGSGASSGATAVYVVRTRDTIESISARYGVPVQTIAERNKLQPPCTLKPGQSLACRGARFVPRFDGRAGRRRPPTMPRIGEARNPCQSGRGPAAFGGAWPAAAQPDGGETSVTVPATPPL